MGQNHAPARHLTEASPLLLPIRPGPRIVGRVDLEAEILVRDDHGDRRLSVGVAHEQSVREVLAEIDVRHVDAVGLLDPLDVERFDEVMRHRS